VTAAKNVVNARWRWSIDWSWFSTSDRETWDSIVGVHDRAMKIALSKSPSSAGNGSH